MLRNETNRYRALVVLASGLLAMSACSGGETDGPVTVSSGGGTIDTGSGFSSGDDAGRTGEQDAGAGWVDAGARDWSCLENTTWARAESATLEYTGRATGALDGEPLAGVDFEVCGDTADPSCSSPVLNGTTGGDGTFTGTLPMGDDRGGFDGYARVTGGEDVVDLLVFFNPPITENDGAPVATPVITQSAFERIAEMTIGERPNPDRGHLALEALDCSWSSAAGVTFEIETADGQTTEAYLRGGMMPDTSADRTDGSGMGGFLNVPPGDVTVTAKIAESGEVVGTVDVFVEPGTVSEVSVAPTPVH